MNTIRRRNANRFTTNNIAVKLDVNIAKTSGKTSYTKKSDMSVNTANGNEIMGKPGRTGNISVNQAADALKSASIIMPIMLNATKNIAKTGGTKV